MSYREMTAAEERAVQRVESAIKALPKSIGLYFHGPDASVVACDDKGRMLERSNGEGMDRDAYLGGIDTPRCEAGDW